MRARVLKKMMLSEDILFHEEMYQWFISHNLEEELIANRPLYLEQYLIETRKLEQLYHFYEIANPKEAAATLVQIAHSEDPELKLEERISKLSRAVGHAKSSKENALLNKITL